jgi:subfamily B ATP-binding cassette protein MsbA
MAIGLLLVSTTLALLWPQIVRAALDVGLRDVAKLDLLALALVGVLLLRAMADALRGYLMAYVSESAIYDLRVAVARHLHSLSLPFFHERRSGAIASYVSTDVAAVRQAVTNSLLAMIGQILTSIGGIAIILAMNWRLALLTLLVGPPIFVIGKMLGSRMRSLAQEAHESAADAIGLLQESLSDMRTVQAFGREPYAVGRFQERLSAFVQVMLQRARLAASFTPVMTFLVSAASVIVVWYGGHQLARGEATVGEIVAFLLYTGMVAGPVGGLAAQWVQVQEALGAADRIFALLATVPEVRDVPNALNLRSGEGEIVFESVCFRYGKGPQVLTDISTRISPGITTALVGPSGAGKTTFVNLVARFYDATSGRICVDRQDVRTVTLRSLRSVIAVVPQEPMLFSASVRENIAYGNVDATESEIRSVADAANATEFISRLPSGFDTPVGERGVKLSIGQRQRIAIARAILRNARILLLDEATSSLDNESEFLVQQALERLTRGRTTIVIAHRLTTVEHADNILVLDKGQISEEGTHSELIEKGGVYRRLYERLFENAESVAPATVGTR